MGERFNVNISLSKNWEHLQNKFLGTGHPDMTRHELAVQNHRDTYATILGHHDMLLYAAAAEGVCGARMRLSLMERMIAPCGAPPARAPSQALLETVLSKGAGAKAGGGGASGAEKAGGVGDR